MAQSNGEASTSRPAEEPRRGRSAQRVSFASFATLLKDTVSVASSSSQERYSTADTHEDSERTALLDNDHDEESGERSSRGNHHERFEWTTRNVVGTVIVLAALIGICIVAVVLGVSKHVVKPGPGAGTNLLPIPVSNTPLVLSGPRNHAYLIEAQHGAVASEEKMCSDIGVDVLKDGGNAVDAAIASIVCVGTLNMFASGIGGGGFAIVRLPSSASRHNHTSPVSNETSATSASHPSSHPQAYSIDFRETAPALANETMFGQDPNLPRYGGLAVAIPGELRGLSAMHERWGRLEWKRLFEPSIRLAEGGWNVTEELDSRFKRFGSFMLGNPDWAPTFAPNGTFLKVGERISRPAYGKTLRRIANDGAESFYQEPIVSSIANKIQSLGGIITVEDIQSYRPIIRPALEGSYRGRRVFTTHAPTSGPALLHILNLMESYDNLVDEGRTPLGVHRYVEAMKFGFAARTRLADPAFLKHPEDIDEMISKKFATLIQANMTDDRTHDPEYYHPVYDIKTDHGTTHTSALDSEGMAVGITSTVNLIWGSRVLDTETGIILNDQMDDFATYRTPNAFGLYPSPYNYPQPGKRPLSSIAPTIIEHPSSSSSSQPQVQLVLGGSGGSRIFPAIVQTILNVDWGMDISAAVEAPRLHDQLFPPVLDAESGFNVDELRDLVRRGHEVLVFDINLARAEVQAIHVTPNGTIFAASDSRKHGVAAGY